MKKTLLLFVIFMSSSLSFSQSNRFWKKQTEVNQASIMNTKEHLPKNHLYSLSIENLKQVLSNAPKRSANSKISDVIMTFPNADGEFEQFRIMEASVMHPELSAKYPNIKSYVGHGIEDPSATIRFSISPLGLQTMRLSAYKPATFIEPLGPDLSLYTVYKRTEKITELNKFECSVTNTITNGIQENATMTKNANDGILRTYRLAMSASGEYTTYHGGSKASALAAMNTTMTRVNGIFENDFNVTMVLIANTDDVIYTNSGSDPYTSFLSSQLQNTLTNVIGESNYDIGHLVHQASYSNGNAGCIGCVCTNGSKGRGYTTHNIPSGDSFDIDYIAHEMGHQFGANHTWTFYGNEGTHVQMEPGSGSTIMGYAGITGSTYDVQASSDPYFHAASIQQVTNYVKGTSCQTNTNTGNAVPTTNAGSDYTIPKGTPFVLTGIASDANTDDVLTYCWEQYDENSASTKLPSTTATTGVAFRSMEPSVNNKRYFPRLNTVKTGATSWQWEAVPNVARTLNFRLTVRDNRAGSGNNNSDDTVITVNDAAGPFILNSPNTNVNWSGGTTQTITWNVAGTTSNGVNASTVDLLLSTDGGNTYPIALASAVNNDGAHDIIVPNTPGSQNRIMVKGSDHVFFDISNTDFTISGQDIKAPIISLIGNTTINLNIGETYSEQGATASDNIDGDLTTSLVIDGSVDTNTIGFYTISYNVSDTAGNAATQITRTVIVNDPSTDSTILHEGYFEDGWDGWSDGGGDCFRYTGNRSYEGTNAVRLRDNSGSGSAMTSSAIDISTFNKVEVKFYFYSNCMENGEDFWLRYHNGENWTTVSTFVQGTDFNNSTFYSATVTMDSTQYIFSPDALFRFQCDALTNDDQIYIDQVTITGLGETFRNDQNTIVALKYLDTSDGFGNEDFKVYPNPVVGNGLFVKLKDQTKQATYKILNIFSQTISKGQLTNEINVATLKTGVYFIEVNDGEELMTKKFIKR